MTAAIPSHEAEPSARTRSVGPSSAIDRAREGSGGTRLSHAIRFSISTGGSRFTSTLPTPQLMAETAVSPRPRAVRSPPTVAAMRASPANAVAVPASCLRVGRSRRTIAAKRMVNKACVWTTIEASPGGMPWAMPKNWKRNCPAKRLSPIAPRSGQETGGRARNRAGSEAMRNRRAASSGGEKDASPILVAMKATPQITTTRRARKTSVGVMLESARAVGLLPVGAREGRRHAEPDVHASRDPALTPHELGIPVQPVRGRPRPPRVEAVRDHAQPDEEQPKAQDLGADVAARRHDELRQEGEEEQRRLGVEHVDDDAVQKGAAKVTPLGAPGGDARRPVEQPTHAEKDEIGRPEILDHAERHGGGGEQRGEPRRRRGHVHEGARVDPEHGHERGPAALIDAPSHDVEHGGARRDQQHERRGDEEAEAGKIGQGDQGLAASAP